MGFDKSEPRNNTIFFTAIVSAFLLVSLIPLFHDYYGSMTGAEFELKNDAGDGVRDDIANKRALIEPSIGAAMERMASGDRNGTPVVPRANDGYSASEEDALGTLGAVTGWSGRDGTANEAAAREALLGAREAERLRREEAARRAAEAAAAAAVTAEAAPATLSARPFLGRRPPGDTP